MCLSWLPPIPPKLDFQDFRNHSSVSGKRLKLMCLTWPSDDPPSSAARANLHHFSSSPPLLVSPPTHTKKFPVSPPSFLIFHLYLFLLFAVSPQQYSSLCPLPLPLIVTIVHHSSPYLPISQSSNWVFTIVVNTTLLRPPTHRPKSEEVYIYSNRMYAIVRVSVGEEGHLGKSGDIFYQQPPVVKIM